MHASVYDRAEPTRGSRLRLLSFCFPRCRPCQRPELYDLRGSMAGLHIPLPPHAGILPDACVPAHGSGPVWFAIPSLQWTFTTYSLPVSPVPRDYSDMRKISARNAAPVTGIPPAALDTVGAGHSTSAKSR